MTLLMVRVTDAREAALAAAAGIDAIEVFVGGDAPDWAGARAIRTAFAGLFRLRLGAIGRTLDFEAAIDATHADEIALALDEATLGSTQLSCGQLARGPRLVAVVAATQDKVAFVERLRGVEAAMLEPGDGSRLIDQVGIADLDAFASACRAAGLAFGLAGGLEAPDVARLLLLGPDVLGFDTAVRCGHAVDGALDPEALAAIRALMPRAGSRTPASALAIAKVTDRIFVRDFEVALAIGAYQAEHGSRQRVRFSVETDVVRDPLPPRDMRDVFSYDVIIETIRVLAERAHVTFVETLAEEVAASLLTHAEIVAVTVKVEKLDVVPGAVGIEIQRRRVQ